MPVADFEQRVTQLQTYLARGTVDIDGFESRLRWLDRAEQPKVPLDIAASGPKVIALAARVAERVTFAVGADPERMAWALAQARDAMRTEGRSDGQVSFGAFVNVGCHPDIDSARSLIRGGVAAFAHFSAMPGSTGAGLTAADREAVAEVGRRYDSHQHLSNAADHSDVIPDALLDRFAVVGAPDRCVERLAELVGLGLDHLVIVGATLDADADAARLSGRLVRDEVLPGLRSAVATSTL
jgi:5,10-methylenetetrahydromethanopterin reductase